MRYVLIISALRAETCQSAMFWPRELLWPIMICKEGSVNMPEHQVENLSHRSHLICMQHNSPIQCYDIRCLLKVNSYRPIRVSNAAIYKLIQQDLCPFFLSFVFFGSPLCTRYYNFLMFSIIVFKLGFYHWLGQYKHLLSAQCWLVVLYILYLLLWKDKNILRKVGKDLFCWWWTKFKKSILVAILFPALHSPSLQACPVETSFMTILRKYPRN